MKKNKKRALIFLIYLRYILPIIAIAIIFAMLFVPSYRFIFEGEFGDAISVTKLLSNSWEETRTVIFGNEETTDAAVIFSKMLLTVIIVSAIVFLLSLAVSIWAMVVAIKCFISDDEETAKKWQRILCVFIPNRIVLCIFSALSVLITLLPRFMPLLYSWAYSYTVRVALIAPSAFMIGGILILISIVLSIFCAPIERRFSADIFQKPSGDLNFINDDPYADSEGSIDIDTEQKERIRHLFEKDEDDKK